MLFGFCNLTHHRLDFFPPTISGAVNPEIILMLKQSRNNPEIILMLKQSRNNPEINSDQGSGHGSMIKTRLRTGF